MPLLLVTARPPPPFTDAIKPQDWDCFYEEIQNAQHDDNNDCDPFVWILGVLFVVSLMSFVLVPCALFFLVVFLLRKLHSLNEQQLQWEQLRRIMHEHNERVFVKQYGLVVAVVIEADEQAVVIVTRRAEEK